MFRRRHSLKGTFEDAERQYRRLSSKHNNVRCRSAGHFCSRRYRTNCRMKATVESRSFSKVLSFTSARSVRSFMPEAGTGERQLVGEASPETRAVVINEGPRG